ncbi:glyoxalase [Dulcicalothrix desertica PCC 7102]|uniref:Glyoxalase n=1 Tax=Dulcicalothrix desertica PCC 7102 TaxID=232991 RepID=A0A433VG35_9CYAN|nr:VOC family protein [Dulcicalothrix desertica]RUT05039.1 glyoxalase [Dulcicalothrix desertica PCC 7102]TWH62580.1 putative enzyme related to lactoylglutathione lyase [Dulcicalothrix desertica PCC 7102]
MNLIRRIVSNIQTTDTEQSEQFYTQVLGLVKAMDLGWIQTYVAPSEPTTQISVLTSDPSGMHPNLSVEVADVDSVYEEAIRQGYAVVYPLTDEPWGVRRFFVREPNGTIINIVSHREE